MKLIAVVLMLLFVVTALPNANANAEDAKPVYVRSISMFRSQVELDIERNKEVRVGTHFLAQSATVHKCLLVVTRIKGTSAYTDATRCPGFATLKKRQLVQMSDKNEVNEEIREATKSETEFTPLKN